jgi:hypothetical protein
MHSITTTEGVLPAAVTSAIALATASLEDREHVQGKYAAGGELDDMLFRKP